MEKCFFFFFHVLFLVRTNSVIRIKRASSGSDTFYWVLKYLSRYCTLFWVLGRKPAVNTDSLFSRLRIFLLGVKVWQTAEGLSCAKSPDPSFIAPVAERYYGKGGGEDLGEDPLRGGNRQLSLSGHLRSPEPGDPAGSGLSRTAAHLWPALPLPLQGCKSHFNKHLYPTGWEHFKSVIVY